MTAAGPSATRPRPGDARSYHDATKHSRASVRADAHYLDWDNKPDPFKEYLDVPTVALPPEIPMPTRPALETLASGAAPEPAERLDLPTLAALLFFSAGLTKRREYPGGALYFRAAASTGALYQTEVYVVAGAVPGLEPGVYHFAPREFALARLRAGDHRARLAEASGDPARVAEAPATLVLSAIYWRNAWKYRARAFRHFFWDAGTMLANLLATAAALDVPARVLLSFADPEVNALLDLDPAREGSLVLVPVGRGGPVAAAPAPPAPPLGLRTPPLSAREVEYPLMHAAYEASSLPDGDAARAWRALWPPAGGAAAGAGEPAAPEPALPSRPLGETILRRGSTRQFRAEAIEARQLDALLGAAFRPLPLDAGEHGPALVQPYLAIHAVEGVAPGAYVWDWTRGALRLLRPGTFRRECAELCLEQPLGGDGAVTVFFLAALGAILARAGSRAYRAVNLAAGLLGGRLYLGAYGLGLGATGLTFYDDAVVRFFEPDARGLDAIFVTAVGRAGRPPWRTAVAPTPLPPLRPGTA